jgi:hypothetical protein
MTESISKISKQRVRLLPERTLSPEEIAKRKAEREAFHRRCRAIFERVRPELIDKHYGWYIAVEPDSGDYFIDRSIEVASQKARDKHPNARHGIFCLRVNESGTTGRIGFRGLLPYIGCQKRYTYRDRSIMKK